MNQPKIDIDIVMPISESELPSYASELASGFDLRAYIIDGSPYMEAGAIRMIDTGIAVKIPVGYEGQIRSRSGLASKHGIIVLNSPGTIDADYTGRIRVILKNTSSVPFELSHNLRIAQFVICPVVQAVFNQKYELDETIRGSSGFGSTGTH